MGAWAAAALQKRNATLHALMQTRVAVLEKILQRELHNSRIPRCGDFPEKVAVQIEDRVHHDELVEYVECLRSKFHFLRFT